MYKLILDILYFPLLLPAIIVYSTRKSYIKKRIKDDVTNYILHFGIKKTVSFYRAWYKFMITNQEFRNVFYCRCGKWRHLLKLFLRPVPSLFINPALCINYEGGLYISHGTSTQIYANKIGKNLWIHHNVTIGMIGEGRPEIGDNVYIGTGAVILGGIKIGNNVKIGANAIVVDDVPDDAVVVSPKARIIKIGNNRIEYNP